MPGPKRPILTRIATALSRFRMRWSGRGGQGYGGNANGWWGRMVGALPGSNLNIIREVGDPTLNSAVAICLNWMADQFIEPILEVAQAKRDGTMEGRSTHRLAQLIANPNPYYDGDALWAATVVSYCVDGNAYWVKARGSGGAGAPVQLWLLPHWQVFPRWTGDGETFITHYDYVVDGETYPLARDEVVHFFDKIDPRSRRGISRLYPALKSVGADNEADTFVYAILKNMGIPGVLISPKDPTVDLQPDQGALLKEQWEEFTGDNRGKPMVPSVAVEATMLAFTPEQIGLTKIRDVPVQRICASLRLPPAAVGLLASEGPSAFDNGGQHEQARKAAYHDCIIPLQTRLARSATRQLGPDFSLSPSEALAWNYDQVTALQEDEDSKAKRVRDDYSAGVATRAEAREKRGYVVVLPRDEVFAEQVKVKPADAKPGDGEDGKSGTE